ncbi:MAG: pyruvate oxidase [Alphaproteobacteria bacterium]|nr:pyruvate oxidase [Alphaproteobacteria bacterium]
MIKAGLAMLHVLEQWGVDHIYGIPGGSINSTMDALYEARKTLRYIQVRHEEVGALAACADAKLTGKIGVCFGSAGPGATHLFNGLYDAKLDRVPVLAIIGQVASTNMNYDSFQEMNENPMFVDVAVYNRTVMTPESVPHVIDEAIRRAYEAKGVSVVTLPVNFGFADIEWDQVTAASNHRGGLLPLPAQADIDAALKLIENCKRPVLYAGQGARGAGDQVIAMSQRFAMPIVLSVLAKGIIADNTENLMGTAARLATKPANEALAMSDLIVFVGSDFPFARFMFPKEAKFIQVDIDPPKLGKRHKTDVAILSDAGTAMSMMVKAGKKRKPDAWLEANQKNRNNWRNWLKNFENRDDQPLRVEPVFKELNRIARDDAVFVVDVGNTTLHAARLLDMNGKQQMFTTSGLFATMGYGLPGGIAAKLSFPNRQVFTLNGDGAFAMVMHDVVTQVRYGLNIINVVFSNDSLGFIEAEQEETNRVKFGVDLTSIDFAAAARAMGAIGMTVTRRDQLEQAFDQARDASRPVVIDVKIENKRPFPAEAMELDPARFSPEQIDRFKKRYEVSDMPMLAELLE